jgi:hypothetical protein
MRAAGDVASAVSRRYGKVCGVDAEIRKAVSDGVQDVGGWTPRVVTSVHVFRLQVTWKGDKVSSLNPSWHKHVGS